MRPSALPWCLPALALALACADPAREPPPQFIAPAALPRPPAPPSPAPPAPTPWVELDSHTWGFRAQFPEAPRSEVMKVPTAAGELDMHMFTVDREPWAFMLTVLDGPTTAAPPLPATVLDDARDGAITNSRGRLVREEQRLHEGMPARRLEIAAGASDAPRRVVVLLVLRERRLYQLLVVAPTGAAIDSEADRFFAALHLI